MVMSVVIGDDNVPFVQIGQNQLRLDLEELDGEFRDKARNELRENPENVQKSLKQFKNLLSAETDLFIPIDDEKFLIKFLRPFKYYEESAFKVLKKYYKFKLKYPKYSANLTPQNVRHVFDNEVFVFVPTRTPEGCRIMIINAGSKWNPKTVSLADMFKAVMVAIEIAMMEPKTQVAGVHVIINMDGFSLTHVYQFSPQIAKLIVEWVQECAPVRLKGIHIINQMKLFNVVYAIFKPFLSEKLKKRISFHGTDAESLDALVPLKCLPPSIGGTGGVEDYPGKLLSEMLFHYEKSFELCNAYCYSKDCSKD